MHDQIKCTRIEVLVSLGVTKWNSNKICHDVNFEKLRMFESKVGKKTSVEKCQLPRSFSWALKELKPLIPKSDYFKLSMLVSKCILHFTGSTPFVTN
jgi:hypothetical protein